MSELTACGCGAALAPGAPWCSRCHAPVAPTSPSSLHAPIEAPTTFDPRATARASIVERAEVTAAAPQGRFAKSDTTFGLTGRIVMTVLLLIPLAWFVYLLQYLIAVGGLVVYGCVFLPIALRDVWRRGRRRR